MVGCANCVPAKLVNPKKRLGHLAKGRPKRRTTHERKLAPPKSPTMLRDGGIGAVCGFLACRVIAAISVVGSMVAMKT